MLKVRSRNKEIGQLMKIQITKIIGTYPHFVMKVALSRWYEKEILQVTSPEVIPTDVQVLEEYGLSQSFR